MGSEQQGGVHQAPDQEVEKCCDCGTLFPLGCPIFNFGLSDVETSFFFFRVNLGSCPACITQDKYNGQRGVWASLVEELGRKAMCPTCPYQAKCLTFHELVDDA